MSIDLWLAFLAAAIVLLIIPGPTILLVVSYALGQGWRSALPISIGVALGDFTAMTLSLLGVGALLSANALGYAFLASRARSMVRNSHAVRMLNRAGRALLIGAGVATATIRAAQN